MTRPRSLPPAADPDRAWVWNEDLGAYVETPGRAHPLAAASIWLLLWVTGALTLGALVEIVAAAWRMM
jgi:hypothetical protein